MNKIIRRAIKDFALQHARYSTSGADDKCREASGLFCELLHKRGIKEAMVDEMAVVNGVAHKAVRIGNLWIDWTARQFDPKAAWPKIESDVVLEESNGAIWETCKDGRKRSRAASCCC
jgi:hypothetical protein